MAYKKITVLGIAAVIIQITTASISPHKKFKNLKVLPQDISEKKLDSIMHAYNNALKVSCDFCHTKPKSLFNLGLPKNDSIDYSLDNPMKEDARRMIRLQMDINKKYFYYDSTIRVEYLNTVSCNTCHRGNPYPADE